MVLLAALDILAMVLAIVAAFLLHGPKANLHSLFNYTGSIATMILSVLILFVITDLYSLQKMPFQYIRQVLLIGVGLAFSALVVTFAFFAVKSSISRAVFARFYVLSWLFIAAFRYLAARYAFTRVAWKVVVVGDADPASYICRVIRDRAYLHAQVVGYVPLDTGAACAGLPPVLGGLDELRALVERADADQVIVACRSYSEHLNSVLFTCMKDGLQVSDFRNVIEEIEGKVPTTFLDESWFVQQLSVRSQRYFWYFKRASDILLCAAGACVFLAVLPVIAALIALDSRGPVFYSQMRVGRHNRPFRVWKLRTMVQDADKDSVHWTTSGDSRITRVGKLIRKVRLDEVPQLFNVLKGEMSLIGPRPEAESLVTLYTKEIPYYAERHMVSPGITGWAQINYPYGNSLHDTREKLQYDFYYIKYRGLVLDFVILLKTFRIVLTGKGAL